MAYQHLFGSSAGGSSGAGYMTLASTPEFYNVMSDDELSNYNNYSFAAGDEHPVKFCHYYKEYKQCFIQSAISFEYDYVGRNSSIAHSLVLTEAESRYALYEHVCPFSPAMFMNSRSDSFERPSGDFLPAVDYRFLKCGDKEHNTAVLGKFFRSEILAQLILAILLSAENGYSIFISLPGSAREASLNAIRLMNILTPAFPAEYRKKMGFMTYVTDTYTYEDISIYFVSGVDLKRQYINSAYCFMLSGDEPYVSGIEASVVKEYHELIRTIMGNILSYDAPALNDYFNDILPKLDSYDRFSLEKINEIYYMSKFLSGSADTEIGKEDACRFISSFYSFYGIVDNKAAFLGRINSYWEKEIEKCKNGGYAPSVEVFSIINSHYPSFGEDDKRQAQRIWSFVLIYTLSADDTDIFDRIFSYEYDGSELVADVYKYIIYIYAGFLYRKDKNEKMGAVYDRIAQGYVKSVSSGNESTKLFNALKYTIEMTERFYDEMGYDKKNEYDLFAEKFLGYFKGEIAARFTNAGMMKKFELIRELKNYTYLAGADEHGTGCELGRAVYEHFHSSCFISGVMAGFTGGSIAKIAEDRKLMTDLSREIENYPELANIEIISLFQRFCGIVAGSRDMSMMYELDNLVNKPDQQKTITGWVGIYCGKFPELILSLFANSSCQLGSGGSISHSIDYTNAFRTYYESINRDSEQMMREINRFIGDMDSNISRSDFKDLNLAAYKEPTLRFIEEYFFDKSALDRKKVKENEALLKRFDKIKALRASADGKDKKHKLFGKK